MIAASDRRLSFPTAMYISPSHSLKSGFMVMLLLTLSACATPEPIRPFSTDGCSMFPDRSPIGKADWCNCCLAHDLAYWRGGTAEERLKADHQLRTCVREAGRSRALAGLMHAGVRVGGVPYLFTPFRWGYGWSFGRMYQPVAEPEEVQATSLRARYIESNPDLVCRIATSEFRSSHRVRDPLATHQSSPTTMQSLTSG
jgi:hypothetical protein